MGHSTRYLMIGFIFLYFVLPRHGRVLSALTSINFLVDNEAHCDFVKLREMLIRTNMEDMREKTHTKHYELYRQKRLEQMGFTDVDSDNKPVNILILLLNFQFYHFHFSCFRYLFSKHLKQNDQIIWLNCRAKKMKWDKCLFCVLKRKKLN